ncbi:exosortase C-terminal domain/associated protein EpsI [Geomonas subterranea]|uniref:EpsI family protein n=1 Tax=Geomonas subterranea TaxID=2847989 RepID=A0ABX8LJ10_9BACT|nr:MULTISPECIES: exosortase C-terminal domain/associated protein EpsI [Geomonas]QXE91682.1 EpsI family protein [Geomonas subterranea]QXM10224.1 EpsI family protein [Geomonas subterranea]
MINWYRFVMLYVLLLGVGLYLQFHRDVTVPVNRPLEQFPAQVNGWRMVGSTQFSADVQNVLKATDLLVRQYVNEKGEKVELYIGYHGGGKGSGEIHSPKHCLPGSGWHEEFTSKDTIPAGSGSLNVVRSVYRKGDSSALFLYWYQVRGKSISDEFSLKGQQIANSFLSRRRDASFIRISLPSEGDQAKATATAKRFAQDLLPTIRAFLPG